MQSYEKLQRLLSEGRIGRRTFIKRATALGLAAAIPGALLAEEARAAAPKQGGKFRQALRDTREPDGGACMNSAAPAARLSAQGEFRGRHTTSAADVTLGVLQSGGDFLVGWLPSQFLE